MKDRPYNRTGRSQKDSSVIWVERKNGTTTVTRVDYGTGERAPGCVKNQKPGKEKHSLSNGVCGGPAALAEAKAMDRKLGVADKVQYRDIGNGAYAAVYSDYKAENAWMRAHGRVRMHGGCGDPVPGDFKGKLPGEF